MRKKNKNIIVAFVLSVIVISGALLFVCFLMEKESVRPEVSRSVHEEKKPDPDVSEVKTTVHLKSEVIENQGENLLVDLKIPESALEGVSSVISVVSDENTLVVKILSDDYEEADFGDIKKGDVISIGTKDNFKNNEPVLARTIGIYPALSK